MINMNNEINIEEVMKEAKQNMSSRRYDEEPISFEEVSASGIAIQDGTSFDEKSFHNAVDYLNYNWSFSFPTFANERSHLKRLWNKLVLKAMKPFVQSLVDYQNAYNESNAKCLYQVREYIEELDKYKARLEQVEEELERMKGLSKSE